MKNATVRINELGLAPNWQRRERERERSLMHTNALVSVFFVTHSQPLWSISWRTPLWLLDLGQGQVRLVEALLQLLTIASQQVLLAYVLDTNIY